MLHGTSSDRHQARIGVDSRLHAIEGERIGDEVVWNIWAAGDKLRSVSVLHPGCAKTRAAMVQSTASRAEAKRSRASARRDRARPEGVRRVEDVEGEDRERCFRLHRLQPPREEPSPARHSFNRAERMLDGASSDRHQARVGMDPRLHAVQRTLIDQAMDRALDARRASWLQGAVAACGCSIPDRSVASVDA